MKTFSLRKEDVTHRWFVVDAAGQPLGRLASRVAQVLRGKHKPTFTPHVNGGDCVVVVNAEKVKLTGRKLEQKRYFRHRSEERRVGKECRARWVRAKYEKKSGEVRVEPCRAGD